MNPNVKSQALKPVHYKKNFFLNGTPATFIKFLR